MGKKAKPQDQLLACKYKHLRDPELDKVVRAILGHIEYASPDGQHRIDVSEGVTVYSVMGVRQLRMDDKTLEIAPEEYLDIYQISRILSLVIRELVPEFPPRVENVGFGWATFNDDGKINVIHPFPLKLDMQTGKITNRINPTTYYNALLSTWSHNRYNVLADTFYAILKLKIELPSAVVTALRKKLVTMQQKQAYHYALPHLMASGFAALGVDADQQDDVLNVFKEWQLQYQNCAKSFYDSASVFDLPEGHIVKGMLQVAAEHLVKERLVG